MIIRRISQSSLFRSNADSLLLLPTFSLELPETLLLVGFHSVGIFALGLYFKLPWLVLVLLLAATLLPQLIARKPQVLAPFLFAYFVLLSRLVFVHLFHGRVEPYYEYLPPEWGFALVSVEAASLSAILYSASAIAANILHSRKRMAVSSSIILIGLTCVWASVEYFSHRTSGATGGDPYAYVQMGIDLATRSSLVHRFDLFPEIVRLLIPWYPIIHVGYRLPMNELGDAITVFPPGGALAFGAAFRLYGESGLYLVNPFFSTLCVIASGLLAWELTLHRKTAFRLTAACISGLLVATANQQVVWAGVTMVDSQAEFLSIMSVLFSLRARTNKSNLLPVLAGVSLAGAYWVRHTQLVLAAAIIVILWTSNADLRGRTRSILLSGSSALVVGIGDLWYHQVYLGGWLTPESQELALFSVQAIFATAEPLFQQLFAANEFGWLAPLLLCGAAIFAKHARAEFIALFAWVGLSLAVHLPYAAVRPRDLLPEFPAVAFMAAYGVVHLARQVMFGRKGRWLSGLVLFAVVELMLLRVWNTIPRVIQPPQPIFGFMTAAQRAAFGEIAAITPPGAVIASTLNDGAIESYSGRDSFRPDGWDAEERRGFLAVVELSHPGVYFLEDGSAMDLVLDDMRRDFFLRRVATLDVPLFGEGQVTAPGALWKLEAKR